MNHYKTIPFVDTSLFAKEIQKLFNVEDLSTIDESFTEIFKVGDDSKTSFHNIFYDKYRSGWDEMQSLYDNLVYRLCSGYLQYLGNDFLYQKFPTFRVHLNGNLAVGDFHKDSEFNHPKGEINFVIPMTNSNGSASIWVESEPDKKDFIPMDMKKGTLIMFDGNNLTHGNKINITGHTRVSMDFRILPMVSYTGEEKTSMTKHTKFIEGEYYKRIIISK